MRGKEGREEERRGEEGRGREGYLLHAFNVLFHICDAFVLQRLIDN